MTHIGNPNRLKSFEIPHSGLRNLLAQVNQLAGTTDFNDPEQVTRLEETGRILFTLLTEHAHDENDVALAWLEQRQPGASLQNSEEHLLIEQHQARLEQMLEDLVAQARKGHDVVVQAQQFYFEINRFHSGYLEHMLGEEEDTQALLWKNFTDAELMEMRRKIVGRMSPASQLLWYRYATPYMSRQARLQWLTAVQQFAPPAFFSEVMAVLEAALPVLEFAHLQVALQSR